MAQVFNFISALLLTQALLTRGDDVACGSSRPNDLTGFTGTFQSPGFPNSYPNNANCHWRITADDPETTVRVEFDEFSTESGYDFVTVYDGSSTSAPQIARASGGKPAPADSTGNVIYVTFNSDSSVTDTGFSGKFSAEKACGPNAPRVLTDPTGSVSTPYYPSEYGAGLRCNWTIQTDANRQLRVNFESFDLEDSETESCRWDYLELYDGSSFVGRFCGSDIPSDFVSSSNEVRVFFRSDLAIEQGGFRMNYEAVNDGVTNPTVPSVATTAPSGTTGTTGTPGVSTTSGPTVPPPQGLYLEMLLRGDAVSNDGTDISPLCAAEVAATMRVPLAIVIAQVNAALGSTLCAGADEILVEAGNIATLSTGSSMSVQVAAYLTPSSNRNFITHHDCSREITSYIGDHSNWVDPIIGDIIGCPPVRFGVEIFESVATTWAC